MDEDLTNRIYEAAFVPELWSNVLASAAGLSDSVSGTIFLFSDTASARGRIGGDWPASPSATEELRRMFDEFLASESLRFSTSILRMCDLKPASFVHVEEFMTPEEIEQDQVRIRLRTLGVGAHLCSAIPLHSGEVVTFVFQRRAEDGLYDARTVNALNQLRPHLARAGLMAARLGLERAEATVQTLRAMGLPAAVMTVSGRVLVTNELLDAMPSVFLPTAHGGMAIADAAADVLFQAAIRAHRDDSAVRSIPLPAREGRPAAIIHIIPVRRSAHDIFSGADVLVAVTTVSASGLVPSPSVLTGLFDLSPAEAQLAAALVSGRSLAEAASNAGITVKTARTYLERVFIKTGVQKQSQLVALLKSAHPFRAA